MSTTNELLQKARCLVDEKHREAVLALNRLAEHLGSSPSKPHGSIRASVIASFSGDGYRSIRDVQAEHPELTRRQIWGVLCAADLHRRIDRVQLESGTVYRIRDDVEMPDAE